MVWNIRIEKRAVKNLQKLDRTSQRHILNYLNHRIADSADPRQFGKALTGRLKGFWRYRVGDYRIICDIHNDIVTVFVIDVGHRKDIYD